MMVPDTLGSTRINLCRPSPITSNLTAPIKLDLAPAPDLPLRLFRVVSEVETATVASYRDIAADFANIIPTLRPLLEDLPSVQDYGSEKWTRAVDQSHRLLRDIEHWRTFKLPAAGLHMIPIDNTSSPMISQQATRSLVMHNAVGCIEGFITRHWLTMGKTNSTPQLVLHDVCLRNAVRAVDTIPTIRTLLHTRHAPMVSTFIAACLFNAATCFAIPVLRAANAAASVPDLPSWPEDVSPQHTGVANVAIAVNDPEIKQYASYILQILDTLVALNAFPCGELAQNRLVGLIEQYGLRDASSATIAPALPSGAETLWAGEPDGTEMFSGLWDELLELDPAVWQSLLG